MSAKGVERPTVEEVRAMNRAIASLRGRLSRLPKMEAGPEYVEVADVQRALDAMEAANQGVSEAISE